MKISLLFLFIASILPVRAYSDENFPYLGPIDPKIAEKACEFACPTYFLVVKTPFSPTETRDAKLNLLRVSIELSNKFFENSPVLIFNIESTGFTTDSEHKAAIEKLIAPALDPKKNPKQDIYFSKYPENFVSDTSNQGDFAVGVYGIATYEKAAKKIGKTFLVDAGELNLLKEDETHFTDGIVYAFLKRVPFKSLLKNESFSHLEALRTKH